MKAHAPGEETELVECSECGLHYFVPAIPGDARFYQQVMDAMAYEPTRWEFGIVEERIRSSESVLDLGAGGGAFLSSIAGPGRRVVGLDHNPRAIEQLRSSGVEGFTEDFMSFARRESHQFDVVVAFHLLEHVPDVAEVLEPALLALRPGGRIFLSVPNDLRMKPSDLEPLDCPPHHLSRWRPEQFRILAHKYGFRLKSIEFEPPLVIDYENEVATSLRRVLGRRATTLLMKISWRLGLTLRSHGALARRRYFQNHGRYGHAMLAELEVPRTGR
jgi:SAM-dependent methyltransferase